MRLDRSTRTNTRRAAALAAAALAAAFTPTPPALADEPPSWASDVKPVLDGRCVVCHSCYNAPCQLVLSSHEGAERGASKQPVYEGDRLEAVAPTRLFVDAKSTAAWREKGFFTMLAAGDDEPNGSVLRRMLELGRSGQLAPDSVVPDEVDLSITRRMTCPTADEFDDYAQNNPHGGMPYATAALPDAEHATLVAWLAAGAPGPDGEPAPPSRAARAAVTKWEQFLNGGSAKHKVTSRYLYEHLFLAHLHFGGDVPGEYFRLVRSRTAPGSPIDEIATVRPFDFPGSAPFHYRLAPIRSTVVAKTHMIYALDDARLARYRELFLEPEWASEEPPTYGRKISANPFVTFAGMPARSRYQFLLDDAHYFIMTFIRGPVCRGQIALNVINDHFFAVFLDPDADLSVTDPKFLDEAKEYLALPAENRSDYELGGLWLKYFIERGRYVKFRDEAYAAADPDKKGPVLDDIWDGDGSNDNALLTIFRHFDSASVVTGFVGADPKTVWVVDFPILERIYYDLVAGFDVFGNVVHQVSTRLYMDYLRMESEDLFLSFLPPASRKPLLDSWYVGAAAQLKVFVADREVHGDWATRVPFSTDEPMAEMIRAILGAMTPAVRGEPDAINRCERASCARAGASAAENKVENVLRRLSGVRGDWVRRLPDVAFLRVGDADRDGGLAYTLIHDRDHANVAFMFGESDRLRPKRDVMTVVRGYVGNYPNFFFEVAPDEVDTFVDALLAVDDAAGFTRVVERWGVRRTGPKFWPASDWFNADFAATSPVEAGLFDLNRYENY